MMCGRYYFDIDEKELMEIIKGFQKSVHGEFNTGEIFPTNIAPIITSQGAVLAKWGFPQRKGKGVVINARVENLHERRMFKNLVNAQRCIVPASAYFEWKKTPADGKSKEKYMIKKENSIIYMAGLYNTFKDQHEQLSIFDKPIQEIPAYTIITKEANESVSYIHDRMPLIFSRDEMYAWLQGENLQKLLQNNDTVLNYSIF